MKKVIQTHHTKMTSRVARGAILILATIVLAGCGPGMSGKYGNDMMEVEFKSGGKAYFTMLTSGTTTETTYEVKDDKVILTDIRII